MPNLPKITNLQNLSNISRIILFLLLNPLRARVALIETSRLISCANQLTGFYMRVTLALNGLRCVSEIISFICQSKTFINDCLFEK